MKRTALCLLTALALTALGCEQEEPNTIKITGNDGNSTTVKLPSEKDVNDAAEDAKDELEKAGDRMKRDAEKATDQAKDAIDDATGN